MRRDMKDVIAVSHRSGNRYEDKKYWDRARINRETPENLPHRLPRLRQYKSYGHNSSALYNFFHSRIGQLWDNVYSEICKATDRRTRRGWWLFKQIGWMVETSNRGRHRWRGFYVDKNRILRYHKGWNQKPKIAPITKLPTNNPDVWFEFVKGQWFWVERSPDKDGWLAYWRMMGKSTREYRNDTKRQVGKKTLKKIRARLREMK